MKKDLPTSFRVIGIGSGIESIIDQVNSLEFYGVTAEVVNEPSECVPTDDDKLAIIVFTDNKDTANKIAKSFHDSGVLTLGLSNDADPQFYDSVMTEALPSEYSSIIESILLPIVTQGHITFDLYDLKQILGDSGHFKIKQVLGECIDEVVEKMENELSDVTIQNIENMSLNILTNGARPSPIKMSELSRLYDMLTNYPDTINILWSFNYYDKLSINQIKFITIISGKEI